MLIDAMVIDEVRDTLGDDTFRAFVARMIGEVGETQTALVQLFAAADYETLARTAHRTSGSAASIGANGLHAALKEIAAAGFDPVYGARPLKRAIQAQIENPLAKQILEGRFAAKDAIRVDARAGIISFDKGSHAAAA